MIANCSDSTESNNTNIRRLAHYIFINYLILSHTCRNMEKKNMEIDESLLDDEDGDDLTICGRESISSLFIRACGIGPEDAFEDQRCASTSSSTAHTPFAQSGSPHAYYLARADRRKARRVPSNARARVEQAGLHWRVSHWQNGNSAWAW